MTASREEFVSAFARYKYHTYFDKAVDAILQNCVKKHLFRPSGRVLYSVVGRGGDEFIDPEKNYCSCNQFFFRVLGGREESCYHLLSYNMALESKRMDEILFHDDEYEAFLKLLMRDILNNLREKEE